MGNRRRWYPRCAMPSKQSCNFQQMSRVHAAVDPRLENRVVACLLAFLAHLRTGNPQNRIEPVDAANYFGRRLKQPVAPEDMRDLVRENDTNPIVGPCSSARGQDDPRTPDSPRHEQCRPLALEEDRRPC